MLGNIGFTLELVNLFLLFKVLLGYRFRENRAVLAAAALLAVFHYAGFFLLSNDMLWELNTLWKIIPVVIPVLCFQGRKLVVLGIGLCMEVVFELMQYLCWGSSIIILNGKTEVFNLDVPYPLGLAITVFILLGIIHFCKLNEKSLHKITEQMNSFAFAPFLLCGIIIHYNSWYFGDVSNERAQIIFGENLIKNGIIGLMFLAFYLTSLALISQRKELRRMILFNEKCIREQTEQYQLQGKTDMELRKFRHDHKEHFAVIRKLAETDGAQRVLGYLDEINVVGESLHFISTNNIIGDAIFNRYESLCREAGISLKIDGKFPDHMTIAETDLCIILSNGLKNAYDAAQRCDGRKVIETSIENDREHFLFISIRNSCCENLELIDGLPVTNNDDKEKHGLGTRNMVEAARRSGGSVAWHGENGRVITEIVIPV